ncbi:MULTISPECIES: hypothetical protein [Cobetia]|uniref:Uncharacterized protein n=1 Tax=Cobetia crustatorum TaxID=553385 RepID=A0A558HWQ3_9GAMM|nr:MULTISPECIES: hypothetical protein [Cobetia]TVU73563.1 hypothetical protein FQP86_00310 [Cobetia crustatorum]
MIKSFMTHGLTALALATSGLAVADVQSEDGQHYQKTEQRYAAHSDITIASRGNVLSESASRSDKGAHR